MLVVRFDLYTFRLPVVSEAVKYTLSPIATKSDGKDPPVVLRLARSETVTTLPVLVITNGS